MDLDAVTELVLRAFDQHWGKAEDACATSPLLVSLTGVPGAGKSTLVTVMVDKLNALRPTCAAISFGIDGYHRRREELSADEIERRGAPDTFDAKKLLCDLLKLKKSGTLDAPSFDHEFGDPVEADIKIQRKNRIVIVEGLYLLLKTSLQWTEVSNLFDVKIFLNVELDVATSRVARRHMKAWNWDMTKALDRARRNDFTNALLVESTKSAADLIVQSIDNSGL